MQLERFQMVDRVTTLDPGAGLIRAECAVPTESPVFEGHFPGYPLLPGVLMIEAMAQTGGWFLVVAQRFTRMALLAQVRQAKLRGMVRPGETMAAEAAPVTRRLRLRGHGHPIGECWPSAGRGRTHLPCGALPHADFEGRWSSRRPAAPLFPRRCCMPGERDALITGVGLVSCLGDGLDQHRAALRRLPAGGERGALLAGHYPPAHAGRFRHAISASATSGRWNSCSFSAPMPPAKHSREQV